MTRRKKIAFSMTVLILGSGFVAYCAFAEPAVHSRVRVGMTSHEYLEATGCRDNVAFTTGQCIHPGSMGNVVITFEEGRVVGKRFERHSLARLYEHWRVRMYNAVGF